MFSEPTNNLFIYQELVERLYVSGGSRASLALPTTKKKALSSSLTRA